MPLDEGAWEVALAAMSDARTSLLSKLHADSAAAWWRRTAQEAQAVAQEVVTLIIRALGLWAAGLMAIAVIVPVLPGLASSAAGAAWALWGPLPTHLVLLPASLTMALLALDACWSQGVSWADLTGRGSGAWRRSARVTPMRDKAADGDAESGGGCAGPAAAAECPSRLTNTKLARRSCWVEGGVGARPFGGGICAWGGGRPVQQQVGTPERKQ